jgi:hypothetical protein
MTSRCVIPLQLLDVSAVFFPNAWRLQSVPFDGPVFPMHDWIKHGTAKAGAPAQIGLSNAASQGIS